MNTDQEIKNLEASIEELKVEVKMLSVAFKDNIVGVKSDTSGPEAIDLRCTPEFWTEAAETHGDNGWAWWEDSIMDKNELKAAMEAWENTKVGSPAEGFLANLIADYWCSFRHEWKHVGD